MVIILSVALVIVLALSRSLYVEMNEASFITVFATAQVLFLTKSFKIPAVMKKTAVVPALFFLLFWAWSFADIVMDHVLFFNGKSDGPPMSIGLKMAEYADDLFFISIAATLIAASISLILLNLKKVLTYKQG